MSRPHFSLWKHVSTPDLHAARVFRDGEQTPLVFAGSSARLVGVDLIHQANAAQPLYALAVSVIAMPRGSSVDDKAATGFDHTLRELAVMMLAKAERKI